MQTKERRYAAPLAVRDWERRDQIAAAAAIVLAVLSIWSLALLGSHGSALADMKNSMDQQQRQLTDLQNQVSENERKRAQDSALILRFAGSSKTSSSSDNLNGLNGLNGQSPMGGAGTLTTPQQDTTAIPGNTSGTGGAPGTGTTP